MSWFIGIAVALIIIGLVVIAQTLGEIRDEIINSRRFDHARYDESKQLLAAIHDRLIAIVEKLPTAENDESRRSVHW